MQSSLHTSLLMLSFPPKASLSPARSLAPAVPSQCSIDKQKLYQFRSTRMTFFQILRPVSFRRNLSRSRCHRYTYRQKDRNSTFIYAIFIYICLVCAAMYLFRRWPRRRRRSPLFFSSSGKFGAEEGGGGDAESALQTKLMDEFRAFVRRRMGPICPLSVCLSASSVWLSARISRASRERDTSTTILELY